MGDSVSDLLYILIAPTTERNHNILLGLHGLGDMESAPQRVGSFQRRNDSLELSAELKSTQSFLVRRSDVLCTTRVLEERMLRTHTGVVETSTDRVRLGNLTKLVLQQVGAHTVQHTRRTATKRSRMTLRINTISTSLDTNQTNVLILNERMENADGVGSTTNARDDSVGKLALLLVQLLLHLLADDRLEVAHDRGE